MQSSKDSYRLEMSPEMQKDLEDKEYKEFMETFPGKILAILEEFADRLGLEVSVTDDNYGHIEYNFGQEKALLQIHIGDGGLVQYYTPMLDLQKPWWREAFLNKAMNGNLSQVGLISPAINELMDEENNKKFSHHNLLKAAGRDLMSIDDEVVEHDIYSLGENKDHMHLMKQLSDFWNPIVNPHFTIQFDNGDGDLWRRLRLKPLTRVGSEALISGNDLFREVTRKMVENYNKLIEYLKQ